MAKTAVVVVHYGSLQDTKECIVSLEKSKGSKNREIIIVGNLSTQQLEKEIPHHQVQVLPLSENKGFAGGVNTGIKKALQDLADYVVVLNNDTLVSTDLVENLSQYARDHPQVGLVSPKVYFAKGMEYHFDRYKDSERGQVLWYAGGMIDWNNVYATHRGVDEVDNGQYDDTTETDFATGCCMLIPRKVIERVGFFNEKYFLYFEDVDYSLKVKKEGFKILYYPQAHLWHKNAASSGKPGSPLHIYYQTRNRMYFGMNYATWRTKKSLILDSLRMLSRGGAYRKGVVDYYLGVMGKQ